MSIENARTFVTRLREDHDFRNQALANPGSEELVSFLRSNNLDFTPRELVGAMAECMEQLELQTTIGN